MINKTFRKIGKEENSINLIKSMNKKCTANIIFDGEILNVLYLR